MTDKINKNKTYKNKMSLRHNSNSNSRSKNKNKNKNKKKKYTFTRKEYMSSDGMMTSIWGPAMWHALHTISFDYPVHPSNEEKKHYREFIESLKYVLPCKYCRINLTNNLKIYSIRECHMKNRDTFSRYVYNLHEFINKMLGKKSGISYCDVRERYEHFRSRCTQSDGKKLFKFNKTRKNGKGKNKNKEQGCTIPLYGKDAKCIIKIVPEEEKEPSFSVDGRCVKVRS
jgi:hypothetical protein